MARKRKPETPPPEVLSKEDQKRVRKWALGHDESQIRLLCRRGPGGIWDLVEACLIHFREKDEWKRDWALTCQNWVKNHVRWQHERKRSEKPQHDLELRQGGKASVTHIGDILKDVK